MKELIAKKTSDLNKVSLEKPVIASVFFRFSHWDMDNEALKNTEQLKIVEGIY
jgi:hypothetical protein